MPSVLNVEDIRAAVPTRGLCRDYLRYCTRQTDAPAEFHLAAFLAALGTLVPPDLGIWHGGNWLYAHFWALVVGASGASRKSSAIDIATDILRAAAVERVADSPGSVEGLLEGLQEQSQQLIAYSEMGEFLARTSRADHMRPLREEYTKLYDGRSSGERLSKRSRPILNPRLALLGGVAPAFLEENTGSVDWSGGFLSRFCFLYGVRDRFIARADPDDAARTDLVRRLTAVKASGVGALVGLSPEAHARWEVWSRDIDRRAATVRD